MTRMNDDLDNLVNQVLNATRYRSIEPELIRSIGYRELQDRRNLREAVKATKAKLHQVGGAYFPGRPDYAEWADQLKSIPHDRGDPTLKSFCLQTMNAHSSTRERLMILETFYTTIFNVIPPIRSMLDLACGLNPLSLPWMRVDGSTRYLACDIYGDMVSFLSVFFAHLHQNGRVWTCDLSRAFPDEPVDLALLLKSIPCLEHLDKDLPFHLLEGIQSKHLLVSFPVASLGGSSKGMRTNYETRFTEMVAGHNWLVERYEFKNELAFLITK